METPAHGELCPDSYNYYCLNGGTCYILVSTPFCWCNNSFKGNRCEEFLLSSHQPKRSVSSLFIILTVVTLLIGVLVITVRTYFYCRKRQQKRRKERGRSLYQVVARHRDKGTGATKHEQDCQHI
ncbi:pro-neuregulin-4, membrane-bound isoform-like [Hypanus sabinus]|uniref:pro-neuregulin-4, membrane-bound isoform-like n=1 Tax=Hypanus sabinus TaxID=79690 RepID=UPI0028C44721|nr:pro-neuregulin-4, membrane-bound isoform-like [Hypanus sabinus]